MSMRLANRLNRVAKELKRTHPCTVCLGRGKHVVTTMHEGDPEPPTPEGCPGCGEVSHIILNYERVAVIER